MSDALLESRRIERGLWRDAGAARRYARIARGEIVAMVGSNGAGKTTLAAGAVARDSARDTSASTVRRSS